MIAVASSSVKSKSVGACLTRNHVDLTQLKLLPVHESERLISLLNDALLLATSDDFAEEARIIQRRLTAPARAAGALW